MELESFEFKKERKTGEFVQDFINLLKIIFGHLSRVLLSLLIVPICLMMLFGYYISTQFTTHSYYSTTDEDHVVFLFGIAIICICFVGLFAFGFTVEYFILLRDRKKLNFSIKDVWKGFRDNFRKYFWFLIRSILIGLLISIPTACAIFLTAFIPLVGTFAVGIIFSILGLYFFTAFMLYREDYYSLGGAFSSAYPVLKTKIFQYGIASYIVSFIFQSLLLLITVIPSILIGLLAFNFLGYSDNFFETFTGKFLISIGTGLMMMFSIIYFMLAVISYGIIYETAKELKFSEDVFKRIDSLGRSGNE